MNPNVFNNAPKKDCIVCGNTFYNLRKNKQNQWIRKWTKEQWSRAKFCCHPCRWKYLKGKPTGRAGIGKYHDKKNCLICGKEYIRKHRTDEQWGISKSCSQNCFHKSRVGVPRPDTSKRLKGKPSPNPFKKGKNHWNWKGGVTPKNHLLRNSKEYNNWRKAVYCRDFWTCQDCNVKQKHPIAHHIKGFNEHELLRFVVKNGVTLCRSCHKKRHKKIGISTRFKKGGGLTQAKVNMV